MKNNKAIIGICISAIVIMAIFAVIFPIQKTEKTTSAASVVEEADPLIGSWQGQSLSTDEEYINKDAIDSLNEEYGYDLTFSCDEKYCTLTIGDKIFYGEWQKFGDDNYWMIIDDKPVATISIHEEGELFFLIEDTTMTFTKRR